MEAAVWVLAGLVLVLVILMVALTLRRPGAATADLKQASEQLLTLAEQRFKMASQVQNAELDTKNSLFTSRF